MKVMRVGLAWGVVAAASLAWLAFLWRNGPMAVVLDLPTLGLLLSLGAVVLAGAHRFLGRGDIVSGRYVVGAGVGAALTVLMLLAVDRAAVRAEEVRFSNGEVELAGTLYAPRSGDPVAAAILVHGSGPESRDEYRFYARFLAQHGIAALAWDKRGVGGSTGSLWGTDYAGYAKDAAAAVRFVASEGGAPAGTVGIVGFSEGEWVGPLAAVGSDQVAFLAVIGASGMSPAEQVSAEMGMRLQSQGFNETVVREALLLNEQVYHYQRTGEGGDSLEAALHAAQREEWFPAASDIPAKIHPFEEYSWWRSVMDFDPTPVWERVEVPVLLLKGGRDVHSPVDTMRERVTAALGRGGNTDLTLRVFPEADHHLLEWPRGAGVPPPVFAGNWPEILVEWIREQAGG